MADTSRAFSALITALRPNFIFNKKLCFLGVSTSVSQVCGRKNRCGESLLFPISLNTAQIVKCQKNYYPDYPKSSKNATLGCYY